MSIRELLRTGVVGGPELNFPAGDSYGIGVRYDHGRLRVNDV